MISSLSLDIAIPTFGDSGIENIARLLLPPMPEVKYVVSWQNSEGLECPPLLSSRNDVLVVRSGSTGVSANRNNALLHCSADIVLVGDDDMVYFPEAFSLIRDTFNKNPDTDIAIFKVNYPEPKLYPSDDCHITFPYPAKYFPANVEMAFRRERLKDLRYWEKLGTGNPVFSACEEDLFLFSALKRGFKVRFFNQFIGTHPDYSTGDKYSPGILRAQGYILRLTYPGSWFLRVPLKAVRVNRKTGSGLYRPLYYLYLGALRAAKAQKEIPPACRW